MDPMTNLISGLPDGGQQQQQDMGSIMQPQPNMFQNMQQQPQMPQAPAQPQYPQAPVAPQMPQMPAVPQWQQTTPQPPAPQIPGMPMAPAIPQMPGVPGAAAPGMPGMPMAPQIPQIPQFPSAQQQQAPDWAQQLIQTIQQQGASEGGGGQQAPAGFNPDEPWTAQNRPRSWEDMRKATEIQATKKAQEIVTQTMQQQQQQAVQAQQQEQQANMAIDQTFNRLRLSGVLPPVGNPNDPNDPGKQAETELLAFTLAMGGKSAEDMVYAAPTLIQRHQAGQYYDVKSRQIVQRRGASAAAMAPIAGGMPTVGQYTQSGGPTQSQLAMASRDLGALMNMGMQAVQ